MYDKQKGFVLFVVLIFMLLFSFLSLYELSSAAISIKLAQHRWSSQQFDYISARIAESLEQNFLNETQCFIQNSSPLWLAKQPELWWAKHACSGNFYEMRYYYALEDLGKSECGVFEKVDNNQWLSAEYYRLTLFLLQENKNKKMFFQYTIAAPSTDISLCHKTYPVSLGCQMRRELSGKKL